MTSVASSSSQADQAWLDIAREFTKKLFRSACEACGEDVIVSRDWKKAAEDVFPGRQKYQNCGLQSARQIIEQKNGGPLSKSEEQFLDDAIKSCDVTKKPNHPKDSGGSTADKRQCVLKQYGVESTVEKASVENVDAALRQRKGVIISSSSEVLWETIGKKGSASGHAVLVTHGKYDKNGKLLGVYVNDTGVNKRYYLSNEELGDCLKSGSGKLNVTADPIWPK